MLTRRNILKAAAAAPAVLLSAAPANTKRKNVIIAGGGIAGLCCGYELVRHGHNVTVLEASGRVGGHVRTVRDDLPDGLYVDAGAEQFTKPGYDLYWSYVREFDLPYIQDRRREHMLRWINQRMYSEEELADPKILTARLQSARDRLPAAARLVAASKPLSGQVHQRLQGRIQPLYCRTERTGCNQRQPVASTRRSLRCLCPICGRLRIGPPYGVAHGHPQTAWRPPLAHPGVSVEGRKQPAPKPSQSI